VPPASEPAPTVSAETPPPGREPSIQEAAEREALARLVEAERRSEPSEVPDEARIQAETERRISEAAERVVDEGPAPAPPTPPAAEPQPPAPPAPSAPEHEPAARPGELTSERREALLAELSATEEQLERRRPEGQVLAREIEDTEERLAAAQRRTAEALDRAAMRLKEVEARASEAESRAKHAEELAKLKNEEMERESSLRELLDRIAQTEERAAEAEQRAQETVSRIADLADEPPPTSPPSSEPAPEATPSEPPAGTAEAATPEPPLPPSEPSWIPRPQEAAKPSDEEEEEADQLAQLAAEPRGEQLNLNEATYEDLRRLRLSVTQTGRVLAYRDRAGGFGSLDELDSIPGFPKSFLTELKRRLTL